MAGTVSYLSYHQATHEVEELFDAELAQMARVLQSLLRNQLKRTQINQLQQALSYQPFISASPYIEGEEAGRLGHKYEKKLGFQVWNQQGQLLLASDSTPPDPTFQPQAGFSREQLGEHQWRTFMLADDDLKIWIKVAQRNDIRQEMTDEIVLSNLLPLTLMLPLLGVLIWLTVSRGLNPLHRVSAQITRRDPDHLAPLDTRDTPDELQPVVTAINQLMDKLAEAIERERRFTADAAHELRTPLAAIRIHAQNLGQQATTEQARLAVEHMVGGVDRMTHVVEQLLTLSRLEHRSRPSFGATDLAALLRRETAAIAPLAIDKSLQLSLECRPEDADFNLPADPESLRILCHNLLDNAVRYTPEKGRVEVLLERSPAGLQLRIADTGPGIPAAERDRAFERFQRLGQQQIQGSGLGLAIAREIAEQHQARISLEDNDATAGGLRVRVEFPCPPAESPAAPKPD